MASTDQRVTHLLWSYQPFGSIRMRCARFGLEEWERGDRLLPENWLDEASFPPDICSQCLAAYQEARDSAARIRWIEDMARRTEMLLLLGFPDEAADLGRWINRLREKFGMGPLT